MHLKRWLTGLIALPLLVFFVYRGGWLLCLLVAAGSLLGLYEYFRIVLEPQEKIVSAPTLTAAATGLLLIWAAQLGSAEGMIAAVAANMLAGAVVVVARVAKHPAVLESVKKQFQGFLYIPLLLAFVILLRNSGDGMRWILLLLCIVFSGDTAALYVGTLIGRHKLAPAISPGKTVEGAVGGLAVGLLVGLLAKHLLLPALPWGTAVGFCLLVGVAGQVGDLFESALKRSSDVKDSGSILPGHGGVLDRIDALLFAAPVAYLCRGYIL
jgi:phosphatidate cytidylyltransferase